MTGAASRRFTFHLIPHTHWDREWYLPRAAFQARLTPVLDGVLDQLERDPAARFLLDGQTVLVEDYLAVRPEQEARVRAQVERGALEVGPWYVLSDLLIPSLHSLRKNLEEGARQAGRLGRRLDVLYSPDAFGHPAVLPRLAAEFGLRWAVVRRGLGKPGDLYRWEAPTGESVLTYHLPKSGFDGAMTLLGPGDLTRLWAPLRRELVERAVTDQIAVFLGADHHAMAADVSGLCKRLQEIERGHRVIVSGLGEFFAAVDGHSGTVPVVRGALRSAAGHAWVLQDVHGSRSRLKRVHSARELFLARIAEPLARPESQGLVDLAWRTLLQCQFHDTLAGTTCDEAQVEQAVRLSAVGELAREIADAGLARMAGYDADLARDRPEHAPRLVLWNPSRRSRGGIVTASLTFFREDVLVGAPGGGGAGRARHGPGFQPFALHFGPGEPAAVQLLRSETTQHRRDATRHYPDQDEVDRVWIAFQAPEVTGLGMTAASPLPHPVRSPALARPVEVEPGSVTNGFVSVRVSPTGVLTLTELGTGTEYPGLLALVDEPDDGDLYTFSRGAAPPQAGGTALTQSVLAAGPFVGATETRWRMKAACRGGGTIETRLVVALYADSPIVRLRLDVDNRGADGHRLSARLPVERGRAWVGLMESLEPLEPIDEREDWFERQTARAPAQRFAVAGGGGGLRKRLAAFTPGFFECEWSRKGELLLTLLRSVGELSKGNLPERPGHAAWPMATPEAHEPGLHTIELALAPLGAGELESHERLEAMWEDVYLPLQSRYYPDYVP